MTQEAWERLKSEKGEWVYHELIDSIPPELLGLTLSTMDFKVHGRFVVGKLPEDRAFHELIRNPRLVKEDFIIGKEQVLEYISALERATGGKGTFRHLVVNTPHIRNTDWNLKFIRFYLNPYGRGFIVCDRFSRAIRWKEIIPNIVQSELHYQDTSKMTENDQRRLLEGDSGTV